MCILPLQKDENAVLVQHPRDTGHHFTQEILAQAMCQSYADQTGLRRRVYAVGRNCPIPWSATGDTCDSICESVYLHVQDPQTAHDTWSCIQGYHVYYHRPATTTDGQRNTARLGLKSKKEPCNNAGCGPNFCCCYAT